MREFSHCSAPEVLYGALSQRTKRIRIGHAVALLPGQYNHPVRVAERAAVLDIVSDGRMDLGTGRSTTLIEMDGFQVDPEETRAQWEEAIGMIPRMWTQDPFSHEGRLPDPAALGHPQARAETPSAPVGRVQPTRQLPGAGEMGLGALCFNLGGYAQMAERVACAGGDQACQARGELCQQPDRGAVRDPLCRDRRGSPGIRRPEGVWFVHMAEQLYAPGGAGARFYKFAVSAVQERAGKTFRITAIRAFAVVIPIRSSRC